MLQATPVENYESLVRECFSSDPDYLKFHWASDQGLESCIKITVDELSGSNKHVLYEICLDGLIVGMFGVEDGKNLNPFFIKPEARKKEIIGPFLECVRSKLTLSYIMGVYDKNEPIKAFMLKNGGSIIQTGILRGHLVHVLKFDNGSL